MKLELSKPEVEVIIERRAWAKAFNAEGRKATISYFAVIAPIIIIPISGIFLFTSGGNMVDGIFLAIGICLLPFTIKAMKKFKSAKKDVMADIIKEEHGG